jgi:hypothetical protein
MTMMTVTRKPRRFYQQADSRSNALFAAALIACLSPGCDQRKQAIAGDGPVGAPVALGAASRGEIRGRVTLAGPAPAGVEQELPESVRAACGTSLVERPISVDSEGGLEGVVVELDAPAEPLDADAGATATIDQRRCLYLPRVLAMRAGGTLLVKNSDDAIHTVRATAGDATVFNFAQPLAGMTTRKPMPDKPGPVQLRCDVHPWMRADLKLVAHRHFTVTGADGRYALPGVAAGKRKVTFWHPALGSQSLSVEVPDQRAASLDATFGR